ncbi:T6SS effector BTH_I2691 family protein [Pseudomonas sp. CCOS 191]|uniref:T6SS effector BTH_I2691 family protein n=1 Tax=Pseudomonas sp. CCOS 191 TaxID=1649877 RepID=UPI000624D114|nr:T6SS effector BTH_I2691 family protein [Pseudomonas sp. CCOS 191]CRI58916.1 hypothetical protein CCOS191_4380 [Pseudomonas sp. CCOS 191]
MPNSHTVSRAVSRPACSARIPILPIRYAVVPKAVDAPYFRYADAGFALEQGFPALHQSAYTLRALRAGYVYVFMAGPCGEKLVIHEHNGAGRYKELRYNGLEHYHRRDRYISGASSGWVWADTYQDTAGEVWIGYSSHLWSNAMTARIMASAAVRRRHMQALDIPELIAGEPTNSSQAHVLPVSALRTWVEDFKPDALRMSLDWSSHPCPEIMPCGTLAGMARHYPATQPRIPAVVALYDAEGISMDLGLSANAYQHAIRDPAAPDPSRHAFGGPPESQEKVPVCYRYDVERICKQSKDYHHKSIVAALLEKTLHTLYPANAPDVEYEARVRAANSHQSIGLARYEALTDEQHSPQGARLGQRIDSVLFHAFIAEREAQQQVLADLQMQALLASVDHDAWLASAEGQHADDPRSLAAVIASYDRDNYSSALGLEMSLALMLGSMSQAVPGAEDQDLRFERLEKWLDQHDSPLYLALAPFNPFKDRADAAGTLIGASDSTIEVLAGRFPAIADITDLTAQAVHTVVLKRLNGKTRWDASHSFQQRILAAAQEANAEKALGLLSTRYKITGQAVRESELSQAVKEFIDTGMAQIEESKKLRISGSRTVTLEMTTTQTVKPKIASIVRSVAGAGANAGMLWLNIVNLKVAYANVLKSSAAEYTTGFASALFGVIGSLAATLVTTRAAQKSVTVKLSSVAPGMAFGNGLMNFLSSNSFARAVGYPAILLGLASDILKAKRQADYGNESAAEDTAISGIVISIGSAVILEGTLAIASAAALMSLAGLVAISTIAAGAAVLTIGLFLQKKASEHLHGPMELWAARSKFGTLQNDGENRPHLKLDASMKLPPFLTLVDEVKNWYLTFYTPIKTSKEQAQTLGVGIGNFDSSINNTTYWSHPDWGTIVQTGIEHSYNRGQITVLLRGFLLGISTWTASFSREDTIAKKSFLLNTTPTTLLVPEGLILNFSTEIPQGNSLSLSIDYFPRQGIDEDGKSTITLSVSPNE